MLRAIRNVILKGMPLLFAVMVLAACSTLSVTSDWDPAVDFSKFRTFYILENEEPSVNQLVDQRIRGAIVADLMAKGWQQAESQDKADLAFGYQVTTEGRTTYQTVHTGWGSYGFRSNRMHWSGSVGTSRTTQFNYTVGTLVIAAFGVENKELVWEASGSDTVNPSSSPEQSTQRINAAVQQILKGFPPGVKPAQSGGYYQ